MFVVSEMQFEENIVMLVNCHRFELVMIVISNKLVHLFLQIQLAYVI